MGGKTQAILARQQVEHGDSLSHRTFRERHITQLRSFTALFSEPETVAGGSWDMMAFGQMNSTSTARTCVADALACCFFT